jgi:hypothetical protein
MNLFPCKSKPAPLSLVGVDPLQKTSGAIKKRSNLLTDDRPMADSLGQLGRDDRSASGRVCATDRVEMISLAWAPSVRRGGEARMINLIPTSLPRARLLACFGLRKSGRAVVFTRNDTTRNGVRLLIRDPLGAQVWRVFVSSRIII